MARSFASSVRRWRVGHFTATVSGWISAGFNDDHEVRASPEPGHLWHQYRILSRARWTRSFTRFDMVFRGTPTVAPR